jgi:hypothetical protein
MQPRTLAYIALTLGVILVLGVIAYFVLPLNHVEAPLVQTEQATTTTATKAVLNEAEPRAVIGKELPGWHTYRSPYGFTIQYPSDWELSEEAQEGRWLAFGPQGPHGDGYDGFQHVFVRDASKTSVEQLIAETGDQFRDRKEVRESILLNGRPALRVIVTTASIPGWISEDIFITHGDKIIEISNGAISHSSFPQFASSFRIL